jgi:hypothetical protein
MVNERFPCPLARLRIEQMVGRARDSGHASQHNIDAMFA